MIRLAPIYRRVSKKIKGINIYIILRNIALKMVYLLEVIIIDYIQDHRKYNFLRHLYFTLKVNLTYTNQSTYLANKTILPFQSFVNMSFVNHIK